MIYFKNLSKKEPYILLKEKYDEAIAINQDMVEAISISSFSKELDIVDSRYVNLKIIDNEDFIFFSNYQSPKAKQFESHDQISALIYWSKINVQIRMKAKIMKTPRNFTEQYFLSRDSEKNALAISSNQSNEIDSYKSVESKYMHTLKSADLNQCPDYWGGYKFTPYFFEFWQGHEKRINKRLCYKLIDQNWAKYFVEP